MPVRNGGTNLIQAIESILAQTFGDFEFLISDNDSDDDTERICRDYAARDPRIRYHRQPVNLGAAGNFKWLVHEARGSYFMWAAADDYFDSCWIEVTLALMTEGTAVAFGMVNVISPQGETTGQIRIPSLTHRGPVRLARMMMWREYECKCNILYGMHRTAALRLSLPYFTPYLASDQVLVFDILRHGQLRCTEEASLHKRSGGLGDKQPQVGGAGYHLSRLLCLKEAKDLVHYLPLKGSLVFKAFLWSLLVMKYATVLVDNNLRRVLKACGLWRPVPFGALPQR